MLYTETKRHLAMSWGPKQCCRTYRAAAFYKGGHGSGQQCGKKGRHGSFQKNYTTRRWYDSSTGSDEQTGDNSWIPSRGYRRSVTTNSRENITGIWVEISSCHALFTADVIPQTDLYGVEPESNGKLSGILWYSAMSHASVCAVRSTPTCLLMTWWKVIEHSDYWGANLSNSWSHGMGSYWMWQHDGFGTCWRQTECWPACGKNGKPCCHTFHDQGTKWHIPTG